MPHKALPGFRDFYPEQLAERTLIFDVWRKVARLYAFTEYDGPPLEALDLYTQKSGEEIVGQLYAFEDKGGRDVALRPEMTPTFARMVAARAQSLRKPVRWFSLPQLFRYERQQKGRLREHFQLNVDIVGEADVLADAELLAVAIDIMRGLGLGPQDVRARVSDRRLLNALLEHLAVSEAQLPAVYAVLDKLERQPRDVSSAKLIEAGLSADVVQRILAFEKIDFAGVLSQYGSAPSVAPHAARFSEYLERTGALGLSEWIRFDLTIVRGLAYYTGIVFELFDAVGEFRAICGGGRYDNLLGALGGVDLPALGFGMGDVVLGELLRSRGLLAGVAANAAEVWVIPAEGVGVSTVLRVAQTLRASGMAVEYALSGERLRTRKSSAQLQDAAKANAQFVLLCNSDAAAEWIDLRPSHKGTPRISLDVLALLDAASAGHGTEVQKIRAALAARDIAPHTA